jgi:hypothetical protein
MQWRPFIPKGGGIIQVDIGGHPPIPLSQRLFSILEIVYIFSGPKLLGPFSGPKQCFLGSGAPRMFLKVDDILNQVFTPWWYLSYGVLIIPSRDRMQKLRPREVDVSTTPIGAHKHVGVSSLEVIFLDL